VADHTKFVTLAKKLLNSHGRSISFIKLNELPADPNKPWKGPGVGGETTLLVDGVFVPPNTVRQFGLTALGLGTEFQDLIAMSQQIIIVSPGENDLREYTSVLDNGERWGIIGLQILKPGITTILGFVGVRR